MTIQPTNITVSPHFYGRRHVNTKLPKNLKAKPKYKAPKGLLISLIPFSLLGFGICHWQANKEEAMEKYNEYLLKKLFKRLGIEFPSKDTKVAELNTISKWKALSNDTIQTQNTISYQEALQKYGVQSDNLNSNRELLPNYGSQGDGKNRMREVLLKYITESSTKKPEKD